MNAVLWWKEYRQQRAVWLAIMIPAAILAVSYPEAGMGALLLAMAFGIGSGAMLLAGEKEDGVLVFLDTLTGRRGPLWTRKVVAGLFLTLSLAVILVGWHMLGAHLHYHTHPDWEHIRKLAWLAALYVVLVSLDGLVWGLLGGALCNNVLNGALVGILFLAVSWVPALLSGEVPLGILIKTGEAAIGLYASWRIYCRDDRSRQQFRARSKEQGASTAVNSWRVLWRLALRQGRWVLISTTVGALLLGFITDEAPIVLWPLGTLLLGLTCGLSAFTPDQNGPDRFLGAQRIPPGRFWSVKVLFWATALLASLVLTWYTATAVTPVVKGAHGSYHIDNIGHAGQFRYWTERWLESGGLPDLGWWYYRIRTKVFFLTLWPVYGFCFGQFFGHTARRSISAMVMSIFFVCLVLALWVASLLSGGVPSWLPFAIPVLLLLTSRFAVWPWMCGRLYSFRPITGFVAVAVVTAASLAGFFWYRAMEVPDVGEPFDVKAFERSLPSPEKNEAGRLLRHALTAMKEYQTQVEQQLGPPKRLPQVGDEPAQDHLPPNTHYSDLVSKVIDKGWPEKDQEFGRWLDQLFQGEWVGEAEKAASLPLGMLQDPRLVTEVGRFGMDVNDCHSIATLFAVRALQLQSRKDFPGALNHLETILALSRQVKNYAPVMLFGDGNRMQGTALGGFRRWFQAVGPNRELLRSALLILQKHEAADPDPVNSIKAQYLIDRDKEPFKRPGMSSWTVDLYRVVAQVPWEKERRERIMRAIWSGLLRGIQRPVVRARPDWFTEMIDPLPESGPGSELSAEQWEHLLVPYRNRFYVSANLCTDVAMSKRTLHATQIMLALGLYQADHGHLPASLDELVPMYLTELPIDPDGGLPFGYRISEGNEINEHGDRRKVAPGQALLEQKSTSWYFPVPVWGK